MASPSSRLRRAGLAFGISLVLASTALLLLLPGETESPTLAADPPSPAAAWTPAPLLALLIVASMSGLILVVGLRPRRG